ncbi:MAG: BatD family protein, partial [Spirochaetes bacterium]|nr:BatD family protein [Spirochaetota bacterium]
FKIRQSINRTAGYRGEQIIYTVTWLFQDNVRNPIYHVPVFTDPNFRIEEVKIAPKKQKTYEIPIGNKSVILVQGEQKLGSQLYTTLTFQKKLIPRKSGTLTIPKVTLQFEGVAGYREAYDFFNRKVQEPVMKKFVIASSPLTYEVKAVPHKGKPENFSGLIGQFELSIDASPTEVSVGDPITLTITLKGRGNLKNAQLPDLSRVKYLTKDYKIPEEISAGKVTGNSKVYTQTIRAIHQQVTEIPAIVISYFDTKSGKYQYARSNAIPITVHPSQEFHLSDVEGITETVDKKEITEQIEGILYNYDGLEVITNQSIETISLIKNPLILFLLILPILGYFVVLYIFHFRPVISQQTGTREMVKKSYQKLLHKFKTEIHKQTDTKEVAQHIFEELKKYLGTKLNQNPASLTFSDIHSGLSHHQVEPEAIDELKQIFNQFDALQYGAFSLNHQELNQLYNKLSETVKAIERSFQV